MPQQISVVITIKALLGKNMNSKDTRRCNEQVTIKNL